MIVADGVVEEEAGYQGSYVGRVAGNKDDRESSPDVDEELVRPTLGRFEGHQVAAEKTPHHPERRAHAEIFGPLATPGVEAERTQPLINGHLNWILFRLTNFGFDYLQQRR